MVNKITAYLTNYIFKSGLIDRTEYGIYQYGFKLCIEISIVLSTCLLISLVGGMGIFVQSLFFFTIFIPLRRYGGGFHFKKFRSCFYFSVIVFTMVVFGATLLTFEMIYLCYLVIAILLLISPIHMEYPTKNYRIFKKNFRLIVCFDGALVIFMYLSNNVYFVNIITLTLIVYLTSNLVEKYRIYRLNRD